MNNPRNAEEAEIEFGTIEDASITWSELSKPLELAIAAGPAVLFKQKKLSQIHISRTRLFLVS